MPLYRDVYNLVIFTWDSMHIPYIFGMISECWMQQPEVKNSISGKGRFHWLTLLNMLTENNESQVNMAKLYSYSWPVSLQPNKLDALTLFTSPWWYLTPLGKKAFQNAGKQHFFLFQTFCQN